MKKCPKCLAEVPEEVLSCPNCGTKRPPEGWMPISVSIPLLAKMTRAAQLDPEFYEKVEHDPDAVKHAALAIIVINFLSAVGLFLPLWERTALLGPWAAEEQAVMLLGVFGFFGVALLKWAILTLIAYIAGVKLLGGTAEVPELARSLAFAYAPICLQVFLPLSQSDGSYLLIYFGTNIWMIASLVIALRQSLDLTTMKAFGAMLIGGVFYLITGYLTSLVIPDPLYIFSNVYLLQGVLPMLLEIPGTVRAASLLLIWLIDLAVLAFIFITPAEKRPSE